MWASGQYGYPSDYLIWWIVPISLALHAYCFFRLVRGSTRRWWHLITGNVLVTLLLLSLIGLVAESYLRFVSVATDTFGVTLTSKRWFSVYPQLNSLYFRDVEWSPTKPAGIHRTAFVGDSFTYGWGINDRADRFTDRLQHSFAGRRQANVEVMNVAWVASDTTRQREFIRRMIEDYDVDEIVLCHLPNDLEQLIPKPQSEDPLKPSKPRAINIDSSFLINSLYYRIVAPRRGSTNYFEWLQRGYDDSDIWARQIAQFDAIIDLCRANNVILRVVLVPFIKTPGTQFDAAGVHERVSVAFRSREVEVVDLLPVVQNHAPDTLVVSAYDLHPNEVAHRLFADAIWDAFYSAH